MNEEEAKILDGAHYLGAAGARGRHVFSDRHGLIVFSSPASRRLPSDWLELSRWCLLPNTGWGSEQWRACLAWLRKEAPTVTTIVSYSDPSVGHDGALYRACNWIWAPVWHVLREPPTGAGVRGGKLQRAKHRWVYLLAPDERRAEALRLRDESLERRYPWVGYHEPVWRRGRPVLVGQDRFKRWAELRRAELEEAA